MGKEKSYACGRPPATRFSRTASIFVAIAAQLSEGVFRGMFAELNLPPFLPDSRVAGAVTWSGMMYLLSNLGEESAADGIGSTTLQGDPATRLRVHPY